MVQQIARPAPGREQEQATCRHHWIIEAPTGPVSKGTCQQCGELREFKNYIDSAPWADDSAGTQPESPIIEADPAEAAESPDDEDGYDEL